jgi:sister-chromatid-cohesion protein PDS5
VRLLVARCLSEVIRICAPDAPFDDETLKSVFSLFMQQLKVGLLVLVRA